MKNQVFNPFLPLNVYIPDGEPHVFGDRVYLFGSHDKEGGDRFCPLGYEFYSAPVNDLSDWSSKGINYYPEQDPSFGEQYNVLYAPDVVQGNDCRYYLYYAMSGKAFTGNIHVAVCNTPDGKYEYYGELKNIDGTPYARKITFDPAVINDGGKIRLYYGWSLAVEKSKLENLNEDKLIAVQSFLFGKSAEEIANEPDGIMGAFEVELADDMLTVISEPKLIVCGQFQSKGTPFEGHAFFEGSSVRKIGDIYYFIYSSENQHELCYATSRFPDKDFKFGGTIISNGDIGYNGRNASERLAATGNNHGSIENINGEWYVFYHRHTHKTTFSRQACAEKIEIAADGRIKQVEMTSCGLNGCALQTKGSYPAVICCNLTNGKMPHLDVQKEAGDIPYITDIGGERFITDIKQGTRIVYKYFDFNGETKLKITYRGDNGIIFAAAGESGNSAVINAADEWTKTEIILNGCGILPLQLRYNGTGKIDIFQIEFI